MKHLPPYLFTFIGGMSFAWMLDCISGITPIEDAFLYCFVFVFMLLSGISWHQTNQKFYLKKSEKSINP